MLPAVVAHQIQEELEHFLTTTYAPAGSRFARFFDRFFAGDEFFKGPYISLGLPLTPQPLPKRLLTIAPPFSPYAHQIAAFRRLTGREPRSTIVATGTGSGKTEAYLYPILDHCASVAGTPGIKAILIYPMNALANDQAERLAQLIHGEDRLRHKVTAGLFTGDRPGNHKAMGEDYLVTNHEALLAHPPDILLTNYRMLDLLLVRPNRARLWRDTGPESLRFLVVDELHTFDGAQGTDLAVLVRRLKERLGIPSGRLACVGTSATIGGEANAAALREYAASLFGELFDEGSVIGEVTEGATGFLAQYQAEYATLVPERRSDALDPATYQSLTQYIEAQAELWLNETVEDSLDTEWRVTVGEKVRRVALFQRILLAVEHGPVAVGELTAIVAKMDGITRDDRPIRRYRRLLVISILSLAGWARTRRESGAVVPLTRVGVQLWARELRRVVSPVTETPALRFHDDLTDDERKTHLPVVHCRECGASGWVSFRHDSTPGQIEHGYTEFVSRFFGNSPETVFLFPPEDEHEQSGQHGELQRICGHCLRLIPPGKKVCSYCGNDNLHELPLVEVDQPVHAGKSGHAHVYHNCPVCQGRDSLLLVGSRSTSLLAVAIAQLHASPYTEDRKVLAFSDSVQDAAHHAGFFGARTYSFNLRMALARFLSSRPDRGTQNLAEVVARLVQHYRGTLGDELFVSIFLAPRLEALPEFDALLSSPLESPRKVSESMVESVTTRLSWDLFGEVGYLSEIGRTLEKSGVLAVYSDQERVDTAVAQLTERLPEEIGTLKGLTASQVGHFVRGLLVRMRRRGAIRFPLIARYLESGGKHWMLGRSDEDRQVLPWAGRTTRLPAFLADGPVGSGRFDRLTASDRSSHTWYQRWVVRALGEGEYVDDVLRMTIGVLTAHGVLQREEVKGTAVWSLPAESLTVTRDVQRLACDRHGCNYHATVAMAESARWLEAPCPRHGCSGTLRPLAPGDDRDGDGYYASLYT
ncbi:MAG: DEAD/DEAH box helicase, partial [Alkalispirochaeta sp.]